MSRVSLWKTPPPSSTLLRFLKSQCEGLLSYNSSPPSRLCVPERPSRSLHCHLRAVSSCFSTSTPNGSHTNVRRYSTANSSSLLLPGLPFCHASPSRLRSPVHSVSLAHPGKWRRASTDSTPWLSSLFDLGKKGKKKSQKAEDLPPLTGFLGDGNDNAHLNFGRTVSNKASNELKLRCTEFDENGNVTLVNGEFKKSELIAKVGAYIAAALETSFTNR